MLTRASIFTAMVVVALVTWLGLGLASDQAPPGPIASTPSPASAQGTTRPAAGSANPLLDHALAASDRHWIHGDVETRLNAGHYTYLRLRHDGESSWVVSLTATTPDDPHHVRALVIGRAAQFHSRRLARDFSPLLFAAVRAADPDPSN
ncbi:MAG: hypothetical protein ABW321_04170 [Polyangiales bacterium]